MIETREIETAPGLVFDCSVSGDASAPLVLMLHGFCVLLIAFGAIPRMVFGPVLLVIEGVTFLLVREGIARALLAAAMLMELVPLGIFALHLVRAARY